MVLLSCKLVDVLTHTHTHRRDKKYRIAIALKGQAAW